MAGNRNKKVYKFVRGIRKYLSHVFETGTEAVFSEEEYVPSELLKRFFNRYIDFFKNHLERHSYECVFVEDRIPILQTTLKSKLEVAAQNLPPLDFLAKCTIIILAGSYLKQRGFIEALDISCDAVCEAYVNSEQQHYLDQWFYVDLLRPPIICTISNEMGSRVTDRVDKFVSGICKYVSHVYETGTVPVYNENEYSPSESLRIFFGRCIDYHRNHLRVHMYDYENQGITIDILLAKWMSCLKKAAETSEHIDFLTQCVSYIVAGSCLKQRGFVDAPKIAYVAIYEAFIHSDQYTYLKPWFYDGNNWNPNW